MFEIRLKLLNRKPNQHSRYLEIYISSSYSITWAFRWVVYSICLVSNLLKIRAYFNSESRLIECYTFTLSGPLRRFRPDFKVFLSVPKLRVSRNEIGVKQQQYPNVIDRYLAS